MATKTNTKTYVELNGEQVLLTNALALEIAIHALRKSDNETLAVVADKLEQHRETITKQKPASGAPTATQIKNASMAEQLVAIMPETPVSLDWVAGKLNLVGSDGKANKQKAYQIVKVLIASGKVVKVPTKSTESAAYKLV